MALKTPSKIEKLPAFIAEHFTPKDLNRIPRIVETRVEPAVKGKLGLAASDELAVIAECGNVIRQAAKIMQSSDDRNRRALGKRLASWGE